MSHDSSKTKREDKDYKVEFTFSFEGIADQIGKTLGGMGPEVHESNLSADIEDAEKAKIRLETPLGRLNVSALDLPGKLITVDSQHAGKLDFVVSRREGEASIRLEPEAFSGLRSMISRFGKRTNLHTEIGITPNLPVNLGLETGVGEAHVDLRGLTLTQLKVESSIGPATVYLPDSAEGYKTHVEGGVGPLSVHLPVDNPSKIKIEGGMGPLSVYIPAGADLKLDVEGGLGPVSITLAEGTALRVKKENGLGPIQLPDNLRRVKDDLYQTEGFDLAGENVELYIEGGMGPVRVRFGNVEADAEKVKAKRKQKTDADDITEA